MSSHIFIVSPGSSFLQSLVHKLPVAASTPTAVIKGNTVALATTFTDADSNGTVSDYTASINWGDGTTSAAITGTNPSGSGFTAVKSHKYGRHGTYTVKVTIKDAGGSSITKTLT